MDITKTDDIMKTLALNSGMLLKESLPAGASISDVHIKKDKRGKYVPFSRHQIVTLITGKQVKVIVRAGGFTLQALIAHLK
tara:strand:+ start:15842 stop:16084 length:243 start_codon:yes stop_codon:yes gene_type:complete